MPKTARTETAKNRHTMKMARKLSARRAHAMSGPAPKTGSEFRPWVWTSA